MTELIAETADAPKAASIEKPKANKKTRVAPRGAHVATKKGKSAKKASPGKKALKGAKKVAGARDGSKTAKVVELLKRPGGVTAKELMKATGWQPHSVRGFLSGTVGKKMGMTVTSTKGEDDERTHRFRAAPRCNRGGPRGTDGVAGRARRLCRHGKPDIAAAGSPAASPRLGVAFRFRQCDKKNHGWREGRR